MLTGKGVTEFSHSENFKQMMRLIVKLFDSRVPTFRCVLLSSENEIRSVDGDTLAHRV